MKLIVLPGTVIQIQQIYSSNSKTKGREKVSPFTKGKNMGKHITERERYQIEGFLKAGIKPKQIAQILDKAERTIYYEISRGKTIQRDTNYIDREVYLADVAQRKIEDAGKNKGPKLKIGIDIDFCKYVEQMITEYKYSPYAVLQSIKNSKLNFKTNICTSTLYHYIDRGIFSKITKKNLPAGRSTKKKKQKKVIALKNLKGESIEKRPKHIMERDEVGHWEMDTVVGPQGKGKQCLLVMTERMTRKEIIIRIPDRKNESVKKALDRIERKIGSKNFRATFKTITCDNGREFLDFTKMEIGVWNKRKSRTKIYYCHPYSSWERGSNENANRLIRRFIPKGTRIEDITDEQITYIEEWMNNYPRKILEGKSAKMKKEELSKSLVLSI